MLALHSRRAFLGYGAALAALAARPASARAPASAPPPALAVVDETIAGAADFAAAAERRGVRVLRITGDVGGAWMSHVEPLWRTSRGRLAGFTRAGALFCLELLARDYGFAVERRARHVPAPLGHAAHAVVGSGAADAARALDAAGPRWIAAAALVSLAHEAAPAAGLLELVEPSDLDATDEPPVYSWVIGPRPRRAG